MASSSRATRYFTAVPFVALSGLAILSAQEPAKPAAAAQLQQPVQRPALADAPLRAVQFVDAKEGWSVGDDGLILHTIDGGQTWERQPSMVQASLRSVHFIDPYTGYAVGRESLPYGGGSAGVVLATTDGGEKWQQDRKSTRLNSSHRL